MHLLIEEDSARLRMNKVAVMKSELHLDDGRRAEERNRLNCADVPQTSLAEGQSADLLRCQESAEHNSAMKYRRYGYFITFLLFFIAEKHIKPIKNLK